MAITLYHDSRGVFRHTDLPNLPLVLPSHPRVLHGALGVCAEEPNGLDAVEPALGSADGNLGSADLVLLVEKQVALGVGDGNTRPGPGDVRSRR